MSRITYRGAIKIPYGRHSRRTVILASDHRGYGLKKGLIDFLRGEGVRMRDIGTHTAARCDHPKISWDLGRMISGDLLCDTVGIGICGSGIGIAIAASKWPGVYSAPCTTPDAAKSSRKHNNSNLLTLGADILQLGESIKIVDAWLWESFDLKEPYLSRFIQTVELENKIPKLLGLEKKIVRP